MSKTLLITLFTLNAFTLDIVKVGPDGKSSIIYIKDNYVYVRECPKYKIVNKRSDCQNTKAIKLIPTTNLKKIMRKEVSRLVDENYIDDPEILSKVNSRYYIPLSIKELEKLKKKKEVIENYKKNFGSDSIDKEEYNKIIAKLKKESNIAELNRMIEKEITLAVNYIENSKVVFQQRESKKSLNSILIRHLIWLSSNVRSKLVLEPIDSKCSLQIAGRYSYHSYYLYKNGKQIGSSWNSCYIHGDDKTNNSKENSCKNWIKKKAPECLEEFLKKPNLSVDIDKTSDLAISDKQRSIFIKDSSSTSKLQTSPNTKKK